MHNHLRASLRVSTPPLATLLILAASTQSTRASESPRWNFEPGDSQRYRMAQAMAMTTDLDDGGRKTHAIMNTIDFTGTVDSVRDDGAAAIKQKVDRVRISIADSGKRALAYDSQLEDQPRGFPATSALLLRALTDAEFTVTMTPRGKIEDVEIPEAVVKAIAAEPAGELMGSLATAESLKEIIGRSFFEFPETLEPRAKWTVETELKNPIIGTQTIKVTYRYNGIKEINGIQKASFTPKLETAYAGGEARADITLQQSGGIVRFNVTAGRLEYTELNHQLEMTLTTGEQSSKYAMDQTVTLKWLPPEAE
jgi:hypothetical protein